MQEKNKEQEPYEARAPKRLSLRMVNGTLMASCRWLKPSKVEKHSARPNMMNLKSN
jgi:hypothetical protein